MNRRVPPTTTAPVPGMLTLSLMTSAVTNMLHLQPMKLRTTPLSPLGLTRLRFMVICVLGILCCIKVLTLQTPRTWPPTKNIRLPWSTLKPTVLWTTLGPKCLILARMGQWPGGGAATSERLWVFTKENRRAWGTGAVATAKALMPIPSR